MILSNLVMETYLYRLFVMINDMETWGFLRKNVGNFIGCGETEI